MLSFLSKPPDLLLHTRGKGSSFGLEILIPSLALSSRRGACYSEKEQKVQARGGEIYGPRREHSAPRVSSVNLSTWKNTMLVWYTWIDNRPQRSKTS
jgi:hypothetical protein